MNEITKALTPSETALILGVSVNRLAKWRSVRKKGVSGKTAGPIYLTYGRRSVRYLLTDVENWIVDTKMDTWK